MTEREKIAHLYRRFGFGARPEDLDRGEEIGFENALHRLLDYRAVDEEFPVHPYEFAWRTGKDVDADPSSYSYRYWWAYRMISGERPAQEQLTLFWHGHFAVSDGKVEDGSMMLQYLDTLRTLGDGKFVYLLKAMAKDPAMMRYLDLQRSLVGSPNENFAREVMELFTMGIGNYTEKDVKEAARALTGWSYVNMYYEFPGNNERKLKDSLVYQRPFSAFALMPTMHDQSPKTILGQTDFFDGDKFLETLANHPQTAKHMCTKLWTYYAYPHPEPQVVERLVDVWQKTDGEIKHVLFAIARSPEFWSDKCIRKKIKSPADLAIGVARQMGAGPALMAMRGPADVETPIVRTPVFGNVGNVANLMGRMGLDLMFPMDVSGWKGGEAWISPAAMVERYKYRGILVYGNPKTSGAGTAYVLDFVKKRQPKTTTDVASCLAELFDVPLSDDKLGLIAKMIDKRGGLKVLDKQDVFAGTLDRSLMLLMAAPEMHVC
jgi:uncharacterized protein (DUF1800 family)